MRALALIALAACGSPASPPHTSLPPPVAPVAPGAPVTLASLTEHERTHGFTVEAVYLGATDQPIGARFVHDKTHFVFDYLQIESAPQGFIWVTSFPTSDQGEPHTQEHLLLGKGNRGRKFNSDEAMELAQSSAFTEQWRTCYHFNTVAGNAVFWPVFAGQLDALLHPDYSDEEIRREVRNFGVDKGDDGALRLEEKGTVYNEMVRAYEDPDTIIGHRMSQLVYGDHHPLAYESGGFPAAIRTMTPADIRAFHAAAYHLANMGMIGAFPSKMALADVLDQTSATLDREGGHAGAVTTQADLPRPSPGAPGTDAVIEYPAATATGAGPIVLGWTATRDLPLGDRLLLPLFLDALGGDESTPLYRQLVDGKTRTLDTGTTAIGFDVSEDLGEPIRFTLASVRADKLDAATIRAVRDLVDRELARIVALPDGDPELVALDARVASRIVELRRKLGKALDAPPGFGRRDITSAWLDRLILASRAPGFKKSLVFAPQLAALDAVVAPGQGNPWRARIMAWHLLDAPPFGLAARPSPELRKQLDDDRAKRIADELARLTAAHTTLAQLAVTEAAAGKAIDDASAATPLPPLVAAPPMTKDDGLQYTVDTIGAAGVLRATFDSMASTRVSIAFSAAAVAGDDRFLLGILPRLMTDSGVIDRGAPIAADVMTERVRAEILDLDVRIDASKRSDRIELVVTGAGSTAAETRAALAWMTRVITAPDWRLANVS